jgi:hypothetical protein
METIEGLNELIKLRLIEKKGNIKLTENADIVLYGRALGINENQLLFKVLEIEETIDWAKEKESVIKSEPFSTTYKAPTSHNIIHCSNCNAANENGVARFCVECGSKLNETPIFQEEKNSNYQNNTFQNENSEKSKLPYILGALALGVILILACLLYFKTNENKQVAVPLTNNIALDSSTIQNSAANNAVIETTENVYHPNGIKKEEAMRILSQYYYDMNNSNFEATNYFSDNVSQFINLHNVTPNDINAVFSKNNEFLEGNSEILNNELTYERTENNITYYSYWIDYSCYRNSMNKNEFCKVNKEVGFDENNKIKSYKEIGLRNLRFEKILDE